MRIVIALAVFVVALNARAEEMIVLKDGVHVSLEKGRVALLVDGRVAWTFQIPKADAEGGGRLEKYDLAGGITAIHCSIPIGDSTSSEVVFIWRDSAKKLATIWKDITGLKGDVGERLGTEVRFDDLTGDGLPEIVIGQVLESVQLCGKQSLPLLFRKVFDLQSSQFRSVLALRPGLGDAIDISGSTDPGDGPTEPLIRQALPAAASRAAGDRGEPMLLAPPRAIADDNPATAWVPVPGNGAGEFVTLSMLVQAYRVTRIGIRALPEVERTAKYDRPKSVLLVTEKGVFRLRFPVDPIDKPEQTTWFDLPKPEQTSCMSLIIEESFAPSPRRAMTIAEVTVLTEADGDEGLMRLAKDLSSAKQRRQAAMLLERAGLRSIPAIREVWPSLDWQGKQRAVMVLAHAGPAAGADLLAEAAIEGDPALVDNARSGLIAAGDAAVPPLAAFLESAVESRVETALELLGSLEVDSALDAMVNATGGGGRQRRSLLRRRIGVSAIRTTTRMERLWSHIARAQEKGDRERLLDLLRAGAGIPALGERIAELVANLYTEYEEFEHRYRLLQSIVGLGCHAPMHVLTAAARDQDHLIRAAAIRGVGACLDDSEERIQLIASALADEAPEVRLAALAGARRPSTVRFAATSIGELAGSDPWPTVRARSVDAVRHFSAEQAVPILEQSQKDKSSRVRAATVKSAAAIPGDRIDRLIEARLGAADELPTIKKLAAHSARKRCQVSAIKVLSEVLRKGAEPLADEKDISAAIAAARAMGAIGGEEAEALLSRARERSNPATDRAIDAALATLGKKCENKD